MTEVVKRLFVDAVSTLFRFDPPCDIARIEFDETAHFHVRDLSHAHPAIKGFNAYAELLRNLPDVHQTVHAVDVFCRGVLFIQMKFASLRIFKIFDSRIFSFTNW